MGYTPENKIYRIDFEDRPGLVVRARGVETGTMFDITSLADVALPFAGQITDGVNTEGALQALKDFKVLFEQLGEALVEWNVEIPAGNPLPPTYDGGISTCEFEFSMDVLLGWMSAIGAVSAPLGQPSSDGAPAPAASIPMEPLPVSQAS